MEGSHGLGSSHRNKRTHSQIDTSLAAAEPWDPFHSPPECGSPSRSQVSGLHLPPLHNITNIQNRRFPGDGFDFRRPMSTTGYSEQPVIDLTADDAGPSFSSSSSNSTAASTTRASRPPRYSREIIIDLEDDSEPQPIQEPIQLPDSPEVEFISARTIDPPRRPRSTESDVRRRRFFQHFIDNRDVEMLDDRRHAFMHYAANRGSVERALDTPEDTERDVQRALAVIRREERNALGALTHLERALHRGGRVGREPHAPRRNRHRREGQIHFGFAPPINMDFEMVGFDLGVGGNDQRPPTPTYNAPPPAPAGFTRSPAESDVLTCPNCEEELCTGETDLKQSVWIAKSCGHVYCGECTRNRAVSKRGKEKAPDTKPFKNCVVPGCETKVSSKTAMFQIYL